MSLQTSPTRSAPRRITYLALCGFLALAAVSLREEAMADDCQVFPPGTTCPPLTCSATAPEVLANGTFDADTCCWCFVVDEESLSGSMTGFWLQTGNPCGGLASINYSDDGGGPHTAEAHYEHEEDFVVSGPLVSATLSFRWLNYIFGRSRNGGSTEGTHKLRALITRVDVDPPEESEVFSVTIPGRVGKSLGGWRSVALDVLGTIGETGTYRLKLSLRVEGADNRRTAVALDSVSLITEAADSPKILIGAEVTQASNADVTPGSVDNEVLKVEFTVAGSIGPMDLQTVEVTAKNTTNDDVTAVKVFFNTITEENDITDGTYTFPPVPPGENAKVLIDVVDTDLPSGTSFIWITYDIADGATIGNTVDAILDAGSIATEDDQVWPRCQQDPSGKRTIKRNAGGGGRGRPR